MSNNLWNRIYPSTCVEITQSIQVPTPVALVGHTRKERSNDNPSK